MTLLARPVSVRYITHMGKDLERQYREALRGLNLAQTARETGRSLRSLHSYMNGDRRVPGRSPLPRPVDPPSADRARRGALQPPRHRVTPFDHVAGPYGSGRGESGSFRRAYSSDFGRRSRHATGTSWLRLCVYAPGRPSRILSHTPGCDHSHGYCRGRGDDVGARGRLGRTERAVRARSSRTWSSPTWRLRRSGPFWREPMRH